MIEIHLMINFNVYINSLQILKLPIFKEEG